MNSKDFIISQLEILSQQIVCLQIRYEFVEIDKSHYIEVLPLSYYTNNENYVSFEQNLFQSFLQQYPSESLTFLSEGSLYEIENPIYSKNLETFLLPENELEKLEQESVFASLNIMIELEKIRKQKKLTYKQLATKLDLSLSFVEDLFSGDELITTELIKKFYEIFEISKENNDTTNLYNLKENKVFWGKDWDFFRFTNYTVAK